MVAVGRLGPPGNGREATILFASTGLIGKTLDEKGGSNLGRNVEALTAVY